MCMILNRYVRKIILSNIAIVFLVLISVSSMIRLIDELKRTEVQNYSIDNVIIYLLLSLPKDFELFLPVIMLLGGLLGLGMLEVYHEITTMQIFGISKVKISISVIKASVPILLFNLVSNEWVLPYSEQILYKYRHYMQHDSCLLSKKLNGFWCMDNDHFIYIERVLTCNELLRVTLYNVDEDKKLKKIFFIERAIFSNKIWNLFNVNELSFFKEKYVFNKKISHITWDSLLTPRILSMLLKNPNTLSMSKLYACIRYLNQVGQNSNYYQLIFWNKIFAPLSGFVMIISALSCSFGPLYKKTVSCRLCIGILIGFIFYILSQLFRTLSIAYTVFPIIGSVFSIVLILISSVIVLWKYR